MVADCWHGDPRTDGLDDSCTLVSEDHRDRERNLSVDHTQVALAQAARDDADLDFTGAGVADGDAVNQLDIGAVEDNCFQPLTSLFYENPRAHCAKAQKSEAGTEG
ncbi:hypothetical protein REA19_08080 [Prescottella equi]|nr:hypothetical protein REA19_08080 [Prescottella equi]